MNPLIQSKNASPLILIALLLACLPLSPRARAVVPAPDGGYPGFNTAEGQNALFSLTTGSANTAVGWLSLFSDATGSFNTATGAGSLLFNTADNNTGFGAAALLFNTIGGGNTAVGTAALLNNTEGEQNTATGFGALFRNTTGYFNTANGISALNHNTTGYFNTALGYNAGYNLTTGNGNVCIGAGVIGVAGEDNTTRIRNIYASAANARVVYVNDDNKIGTLASSRRFKEEIKPMEQASEVLFALKPVSFRYKKEFDAGRAPMFGLIAEDVEQVDPDLVSRNEKGEVETVRYEQINAMLLNEFLKAHREVQEQKATIAQLKSTVEKQEATNAQQQKQIEALTAGLQKVSAQLEASKPAPQVVTNNQ
jgi:uncharacterized coiled-coil protein SlyX